MLNRNFGIINENLNQESQLICIRNSNINQNSIFKAQNFQIFRFRKT